MAGLSADVKKELVRKEARDGWQKGVVRIVCARRVHDLDVIIPLHP